LNKNRKIDSWLYFTFFWF